MTLSTSLHIVNESCLKAVGANDFISFVMYIPVYCVGEEPTAGVVVPGLEEDWVEPVTVAHTAQGLSHFKPKEAAKR